MFTQIQLSICELIADVENLMDKVASYRAGETNPNVFNEFGGRLIAYTEMMSLIRKTQAKIDEHIADILKNTTDGNYMDKLSILEEENDVLHDKVEILQDELKKYKLSNKNLPAECLQELDEIEMQKRVEEYYLRDDVDGDNIMFDIKNDEDDSDEDGG